MLYFTIYEQSKWHPEIRTHEGTGDSRDYSLPVSKQLTFMYQYSIYEEGITWQNLSSTITEEDFNGLFDKGRRLFFLETNSSYFTVKIEEYNDLKKRYKEVEEIKANAILFEDLQTYCHNFVNGFFTFDEFKKIINTYKDFEKDKNREVFDLKISQIEHEIELRQGTA